MVAVQFNRRESSVAKQQPTGNTQKGTHHTAQVHTSKDGRKYAVTDTVETKTGRVTGYGVQSEGRRGKGHPDGEKNNR